MPCADSTIAAAQKWLDRKPMSYSSVSEIQAFDLIYDLLAVVDEQATALCSFRDGIASVKKREHELGFTSRYNQRSNSTSICR